MNTKKTYPKFWRGGCSKINRAMAGAMLKGVGAAKAGAGRETCPYNERDLIYDARGRANPTFARAFARAWQDGYDATLANDKSIW